jgi:hypothetical protein
LHNRLPPHLAQAIVESAQKRLLAMWLHVSQSVASASTQQRSTPDMRVLRFRVLSSGSASPHGGQSTIIACTFPFTFFAISA